MQPDGLVTVKSTSDPLETLSKIEKAIVETGMTVFARIDHTAGAKAAGLSLRPTEVIIFGNAKGGTPLMQAVQTIGIDLPLKILVWQDQAADTWISYNDPSWLAARHALGSAVDKPVLAMTEKLAAVIAAACAG